MPVCSLGFYVFVDVGVSVIEQWDFGKQSVVTELDDSSYVLICLVSEQILHTSTVFHRYENLLFVSVCNISYRLCPFRPGAFEVMNLFTRVMELGFECWLVTRPNSEVFDSLTKWPHAVVKLSKHQMPHQESHTVMWYSAIWYDTNIFRVSENSLLNLSQWIRSKIQGKRTQNTNQCSSYIQQHICQMTKVGRRAYTVITKYAVYFYAATINNAFDWTG